MINSHSSVNYVEPNISSTGIFSSADENGNQRYDYWKVDDYYDRAPRLEDYSIYFNLEVEICSRENISANKTITSDVLILSYRTKQNESTSTINFMGGTKVKCNDAKDTSMRYLTTNYADMYVGDLIDYGTTEMIGIKSIDIDYQGSCVPIVTVKFTDVRGISLFQPTELSRSNSYQGIKGINSDNVAQSFFQCFFRVPMPRFTMTIKGFYGKPVTYECMCDKFVTNFNSNTGDFDITTKFIGYSYSFLTDVSIDALLAAPYSDYGGLSGVHNSYWDREVKSGRFTIWNKGKTNKDPMPTLFEIWQEMKHLLEGCEKDDTAIVVEEKSHEEEIQELQTIKSLYKKWYTTLFDICVERYGKDYCYLFKRQGKDDEYSRILILAKESSPLTLEGDYTQYPDEFKLINKNLHAAIEEYNSKESNFKELDNVSINFSDYHSCSLFNKTYVGTNGHVVFNGFTKYNRLPETEVINNVFYGVDYATDGSTQQEVTDKENKHKKHVLEAIYGDGVDQHIRCYSISQDYSSIVERINALQADANKSVEEKTKEERVKEINRRMFSKMTWYPTVENFTRIMMAHMETLMNLMYNVATKCEGRKASDLGVTTGVDGSCIDINSAKNTIPPFPRVTKNIVGDDGITKVEDTWVGEFNNGTIPFEEVDFIDGFFNAIEKMQAIRRDTEVSITESKKEVVNESENFGGLIKHPLTSFDFFITKSPYGISSEIANENEDFYHLAGKVAIRMFNILSLNHLNLKHNKKFKEDNFLRNLGRVEADNFFENVKISNERLLTMLRSEDIITPKTIIDKVTKVDTSEKCPWGNTALFSVDNNGNMWLNRYKVSNNNYNNWIYPIQDVSFSNLDTIHKQYNSGQVVNGDGSISIFTLPNKANERILNTSNGYGNVLITSKINIPSDSLNNANTDCDTGYTEIYEILSSKSNFDETSYADYFKVESRNEDECAPSFSSKKEGKINSFSIDNGFIKLDNDETYDANDVDSLVSQVKDGNTEGFTITEVFGIKDGHHDYSSSFKHTHNNLTSGGLWFGSYEASKSLVLPDIKNLFALLSIKTNCNAFYSDFFGEKKTFIYLPKIAALQLGAVCFASNGIKNDLNFRSDNLKNIIKDRIGLDEDFVPLGIRRVVTNFSKQVIYQFAKYFYDWCVSSSVGKNLSAELLNDSNYIQPSKNTGRALLNQNSPFVKSLTNDLVSPVLVINLSVNAVKIDSNTSALFRMQKGKAEIFLSGFLDRLKERYRINFVEDSQGNLIKTTDEPKQTTNDMKSELYRYMKQLYDKWIPMSSFEDWTLEHYFVNNSNDSSGAENEGHKFYFVDSYYNNIGDKLIVNPKNIMERIDALLSNGDVNSMMLGFMADIYAFNRCMMKCIQNFFDLTQEGSMDEMFVPMPFNSINWSKINKYSSFVIVYPYEPSKNLNIPNNEYNDDGFMLNDENETPKAIRSKSNVKGQYMLPAFGVAYGKQYQSYFKSVNVNMNKPIATQQSIRAKHYILQESADVKTVGITSQDLYDIYSTQSYTCDVEMMGCAWVQPMMYFVLLNIPMFRGSYMIMKVKHSIKPGDMTTTFTGCRMANVSNKIIEDIFTDDEYLLNGLGNEKLNNKRQAVADVDNDCEYKVFPLWGTDNVSISKDEFENAMNAMKILIDKYDFKKQAAAGICGNIFQESGWKIHALNGLGAFGLCQWLGDRKQLLFKKYGSKPSFSQQLEYIDYEWNNESGAKGHRAKLNEQTKPDDAASVVMKYFERPGKKEANESNRRKKAIDYYNAYNSSSYSTNSAPSNKNPNDKKDVNQALFDAINNSAQATPSINTALSLSKYGDYYMITQSNKKTDKLGVVFDMMLNSKYYDNIQKLYWVYEANGLQANPVHIDFIAAEKIKQESKSVRVAQSGAIGATEMNEIPSDASEKLLKALAKHAKSVGNINNFKKEVPQVKDEKILEGYKPKDCDSLFDNETTNYSNNVNGVGMKIDESLDMKIGNWNVGASVKWLITHSLDNSKSICAFAVQQAIIAGGIECPSGSGYRKVLELLKTGNWFLTSSGSTGSSEFLNYKPSVGDVIGMTKGNSQSETGHVCMFCGSGNGWISDFKQGEYYRRIGSKKSLMETAYVYNEVGNGTYWIARYKGNGKTTTKDPMRCFNGKCLKS